MEEMDTVMDITPEIHFAQHLASNDPKIRDKTLEDVAEYISTIPSDAVFSEDQMQKLWKGLFYYFWHCDKPLVQEEKAKVISNFVHLFKQKELTFLFIDIFYQTMCREWHAIDVFRLEKYMMLFRQILHESYEFLKKQKWSNESIVSFKRVMKKTIINPDCDNLPFGAKSHVVEMYLEELAMVGSEELTPNLVRKFIVPYCRILTKCDNIPFVQAVKKNIFLYLVNQDESGDAFPFLKFNSSSIQMLLRKYANAPSVPKARLRVIYGIIKRFQDYSCGVDITEKLFNPIKSRDLSNKDIMKAAKRLIKQEKEFSRSKAQFKKTKTRTEPKIIDL